VTRADRLAVALLATLITAGAAMAKGEAAPGATREAGFDVWFSIDGEPAVRAATIEATRSDLARTPLRHGVRFGAPAASSSARNVLALVEVSLVDDLPGPRIVLAHGDGVTTPGWLVHALLRGLEAVGAHAELGWGPVAWIDQLVARSTRSKPAGVAAEALVAGRPAVGLRLPAGAGPAAAGAQLAAIARRLEGLDGYPPFEDRYLVAAGRVWLRRDLYWLGLPLWLLLFWRRRGRPGRELRWLVLASWLVAPAFAVVLLLPPAMAAALAPERRGAWRLAMLGPGVLFVARFAAAVAAGQRPTVALVPAVLVMASLAAYVWPGAFARRRVGNSEPVSDVESGDAMEREAVD
jgi:hypothetical protein